MITLTWVIQSAYTISYSIKDRGENRNKEKGGYKSKKGLYGDHCFNNRKPASCDISAGKLIYPVSFHHFSRVFLKSGTCPIPEAVHFNFRCHHIGVIRTLLHFPPTRILHESHSHIKSSWRYSALKIRI